MDLTRPHAVVAALSVGVVAFSIATDSRSHILAAAEHIGSQRTAAAAPELQAIHARIGVNYGDDFVIAEPVGPDVRLRVVRVASANEWCPGVLVQAVEKVLPRTTVQAVARLRVCSITDRRVATALKRAPDHQSHIDFIGHLTAVIAVCDGTDREFAFIVPPMIDHDLLRRQSPDVKALWDLGARLRALAFVGEADDPDFPFEGATPERRAAREALGTSMVPVLLAGKYETYLRRQPTLDGYTGPPAVRVPEFAEVVERQSLKLETYVPPVMHPIAISARLFRDVRLRVSVNSATGVVTEVEELTKEPLLAPSAIAAVRAWRFEPGAAPDSPFEISIRFRLRCP